MPNKIKYITPVSVDSQLNHIDESYDVALIKKHALRNIMKSNLSNIQKIYALFIEYDFNEEDKCKEISQDLNSLWILDEVFFQTHIDDIKQTTIKTFKYYKEIYGIPSSSNNLKAVAYYLTDKSIASKNKKIACVVILCESVTDIRFTELQRYGEVLTKSGMSKVYFNIFSNKKDKDDKCLTDLGFDNHIDYGINIHKNINNSKNVYYIAMNIDDLFTYANRKNDDTLSRK